MILQQLKQVIQDNGITTYESVGESFDPHLHALLNRPGVSELYKQILLIQENKGNVKSKLFELAKDILHVPLQIPQKKSGELNPQFLGIIPTRICNGACNYCDFNSYKIFQESMPYKLAADIVDWYADLSKKQSRNFLEIHFFGGEPMAARDVIEVIVHRARLISAKLDMIPYFEISTNGQYSFKDAKYLGNYFNKVILSFDGFKEFQNKHRPLKGNNSSFENALETAKIISDSGAELCIRCCISKLNVSKMEEITSWFCKDFRLSAINFEILCASSLSESNNLFPPDPIEFALHFQNSREIANDYGVEVIYSSDISEQPQVSSCPAGKDTVIISPDGRISNCYLMPERWQKVGLDLDIGFFYSKDKVEIFQEKLEKTREMVLNKPRCSSCFCKWSCAGSCHVGNSFPGCSLQYDNFCKQTRLISTFTLLSKLDLENKIIELKRSPEALNILLNQVSDTIKDFAL
jgi:uncharacterized protein